MAGLCYSNRKRLKPLNCVPLVLLLNTSPGGKKYNSGKGHLISAVILFLRICKKNKPIISVATHLCLYWA
jgi:hypothetical protein